MMDQTKMIEVLQEQNRELEKMYKEDTERLRTERDQWKNRCLEAEASKAQATRQLRHV